LAELPTIEDLANVPEERLLKLWEGLGYYSRAKNLKKAAQTVMEQFGGQLPITAKELRALPGIGDYTAGAIASMAFGQPEPAVDGNVLRVVTRIIGDDSDIMLTTTKKRITGILQTVYPTGEDAGVFTEGLMELGETICIPNGAPKCELCPVKEICVAFKENLTDKLPVRSEKKKRKIEKKTVFLFMYKGKYALCKRPDKGLLAGMWELPNIEGELSQEQTKQWAVEHFADENTFVDVGKATHIFTHIEWHMNGYFFECTKQHESFIWVTPEELLEEYALPTAFRVYKNWILRDLL
jgi:A/G-specific adenine glycosylase